MSANLTSINEGNFIKNDMVGSALEVLMQLVYGLPIEEMPYGTRQGPVL